MEPVEINAGRYYLRLLRADDRIDDRPALLAACADADLARWITGGRPADLTVAGEYVRDREDGWQADLGCCWAVAEPTTGALIGEVRLHPLDLVTGTAGVSCWVVPERRGQGVATEVLGAALRFGQGALGLRRLDHRPTRDDPAASRLAARYGFTRQDDESWQLVPAG
ncbi:MAG TPA: GNAT family N-acetyltransferase [Pseudonocardiaceae bacterium]|jgi:RimJ/RimL family protein N-acetyltransferase|nr:GNAT family N-acetyltransferase [Pseudonocardiaceae bacterium]